MKITFELKKHSFVQNIEDIIGGAADTESKIILNFILL